MSERELLVVCRDRKEKDALCDYMVNSGQFNDSELVMTTYGTARVPGRKYKKIVFLFPLPEGPHGTIYEENRVRMKDLSYGGKVHTILVSGLSPEQITKKILDAR